jgi:hypothetical protein
MTSPQWRRPPWCSPAPAVDETGVSGLVGIIAIGVSLALVLLLTLLGTGTFSSSGSGGGPAVFSNSSSEQQLKLCVEGRPSTYGNPPTSLQQATCTRDLAGQLGGAPVPGGGTGTTSSTIPSLPG